MHRTVCIEMIRMKPADICFAGMSGHIDSGSVQVLSPLIAKFPKASHDTSCTLQLVSASRKNNVPRAKNIENHSQRLNLLEKSISLSSGSILIVCNHGHILHSPHLASPSPMSVSTTYPCFCIPARKSPDLSSNDTSGIRTMGPGAITYSSLVLPLRRDKNTPDSQEAALHLVKASIHLLPHQLSTSQISITFSRLL